MTNQDTDATSESNGPRDVPRTGTGHPAGAATGADGGELDEEGEFDEDRGTGFDPDQRRFLWTITGVLVLAMFGSAGLNIAYMDRQRSRQVAANRAADEFRVTDEAFKQSQQNEGQAMVRSLQVGDNQTYQQALAHLMGIYQARQRAFVAMRHEQGLDEQVEDPTGAEFAGFFESNVKRAAAQGRGTRPSTTQSAASQPAPAGPTAPAVAAPPGVTRPDAP